MNVRNARLTYIVYISAKFKTNKILLISYYELMLQTHYNLKIRTGIQTLEKLFTTDSSYQYNILRKEQIFLPDVFSHVVVRYIKMKNVTRISISVRLNLKSPNWYPHDVTDQTAKHTTKCGIWKTILSNWNEYRWNRQL